MLLGWGWGGWHSRPHPVPLPTPPPSPADLQLTRTAPACRQSTVTRYYLALALVPHAACTLILDHSQSRAESRRRQTACHQAKVKAAQGQRATRIEQQPAAAGWWVRLISAGHQTPGCQDPAHAANYNPQNCSRCRTAGGRHPGLVAVRTCAYMHQRIMLQALPQNVAAALEPDMRLRPCHE